MDWPIATASAAVLVGIMMKYCPWWHRLVRRRPPPWIPRTTLPRPQHGILLVNLGTPDDTSTTSVRRYLREFLMDPRVIDIPWWQRFILVQCIIAPFRAPSSAKLYRELWHHHNNSSPLKTNGYDLTAALQARFDPATTLVVFGMRYQNPSLESALRTLREAGVTSITVLPLFAQYASSSTGSALEAVMLSLSSWDTIPALKTISSFVTNPLYIAAVCDVAAPVLATTSWERVLMSFHGIPRRQAEVSCAYCRAKLDVCSVKMDDVNRLCYRAQCFYTARTVAAGLKLTTNEYSVMFQSRLGRAEWLRPYASEVVEGLPKGDAKVTRVVALSLSFVAECLETTMEVGDEYKELFIENGGKEWTLVPSLNTTPKWLDCVVKLVSP